MISKSFNWFISYITPCDALHPLATLAREYQWIPYLSPTPGIKSTKTTCDGGISLSQATHVLSPVVYREINSLTLDRETNRPSIPSKTWMPFLKFLGKHANCSALLFNGYVPIIDQEDSKGECDMNLPNGQLDWRSAPLTSFSPIKRFWRVFTGRTTPGNGTKTTFKSDQLNQKLQKSPVNRYLWQWALNR